MITVIVMTFVSALYLFILCERKLLRVFLGVALTGLCGYFVHEKMGFSGTYMTLIMFAIPNVFLLLLDRKKK